MGSFTARERWLVDNAGSDWLRWRHYKPQVLLNAPTHCCRKAYYVCTLLRPMLETDVSRADKSRVKNIRTGIIVSQKSVIHIINNGGGRTYNVEGNITCCTLRSSVVLVQILTDKVGIRTRDPAVPGTKHYCLNKPLNIELQNYNIPLSFSGIISNKSTAVCNIYSTNI